MTGTRRDILKAALAGAACSAIWTQLADAAPAAPDDHALLEAVSDLTIPATNVPGAVAARVPAFLALAIAQCTLGAKGDEVSRLRADLHARAGEDFCALPPARQLVVLESLDWDCFLPGADQSGAWRTVKALIIAGYYSSETGGAKDQRYELVPGRFDADIPYRPGDAALSNDWAGVAFR